METQKIPNSQNNLKKEEESWMNCEPWFQTILHLHTLIMNYQKEKLINQSDLQLHQKE